MKPTERINNSDSPVNETRKILNELDARIERLEAGKPATPLPHPGLNLTAENTASQMAKTLDDWRLRYDQLPGFNTQKWIKDALVQYGISCCEAEQSIINEQREKLAEKDAQLRDFKAERDTLKAQLSDVRHAVKFDGGEGEE
jgi:hypothetical protein